MPVAAVWIRNDMAPAMYEFPPDVIGEATINAIAHRDYHSNAAVEVRLFVDRLEVWNPGRLPGTLSLENLREDHPSIPNNPLVAESLYLARYIERVGSGTRAMIEMCREAGLPEPNFEVRQGSFVITLWRGVWTDEVVAGLGLNDRRTRAIRYLKSGARITNSKYQELAGVSRATATPELDVLLEKGVVEKIGTTGKGTHYVLTRRRITKASKDS